MSDRPYHHGDLRNALIDRGRAVLRESGADGVTLRSLARDLGVTATATYRHFPDRTGLLRAVASAELDHLGRAIDATGPEGAGGPGEARVVAHAYLAWSLANPHAYRLAMSSLGVGHPEGITGTGDTVPRAQQRFVAASPDGRALTLWALVHGVTSLALEGVLSMSGRDPHAVLDATLADAGFTATPTSAPGRGPAEPTRGE